jgi:hypothetical protein
MSSTASSFPPSSFLEPTKRTVPTAIRAITPATIATALYRRPAPDFFFDAGEIAEALDVADGDGVEGRLDVA